MSDRHPEVHPMHPAEPHREDILSERAIDNEAVPDAPGTFPTTHRPILKGKKPAPDMRR